MRTIIVVTLHQLPEGSTKRKRSLLRYVSRADYDTALRAYDTLALLKQGLRSGWAQSFGLRSKV
ncbi:MAG: hypothetical protein IKO28_01725 [Prevotella sp.]|nr:hypothetical protein [Prevotella sp.]MBR4650158.1 hypothetical protein [Prevotella sp.]